MPKNNCYCLSHKPLVLGRRPFVRGVIAADPSLEGRTGSLNENLKPAFNFAIAQALLHLDAWSVAGTDQIAILGLGHGSGPGLEFVVMPRSPGGCAGKRVASLYIVERTCLP